MRSGKGFVIECSGRKPGRETGCVDMRDVRYSCVAGRFYPDTQRACEEELARYTDFDGAGVEMEGAPVSGIVPHAGWAFSGPTAGKVFAFLKQRAKPETFIVFGATHRYGGRAPVMMCGGRWETPLGPMLVDGDACQRLMEAFGGKVLLDVDLHEGEHSIEVQAPFIQYLFPGARIVPVLTPSGPESAALGAAAGEVARESEGSVAVIGSTDLTHYGYEYGFAPKGVGPSALRWVRDVNDRRVIDLAAALRADEIVDEAKMHANACGAGAMAAATAAARAAGRERGVLLDYATSHDAAPERPASMFVGYAGMVF